MADWNAELYSKFEKERTLPCYDLVRVVETVPETVLDVGCGIGNSTQVLADTFPAAHIIGADNSPDMLRYARENHPGLEFIELDAAHDLEKLPEKYDLVFSNACLQWLPDHRTRIRELMGLLNEGGTLAVQIPSQAKHPVHHLLTETAHGARWQGKITSFRQYNELTEEEYFDALSENASAFLMWEIMYFFECPRTRASSNGIAARVCARISRNCATRTRRHSKPKSLTASGSCTRCRKTEALFSASRVCSSRRESKSA